MTEEKKQPEEPNSSKDVEKDIVKNVFGRKRDPEAKSSFFKDQPLEKESKYSAAYKKAKGVPTPLPKAKAAVSQKLVYNKRLKGRLPLGVDLGSHSIKIAQLVYEDRQLKIAKLIMEELPVEFLDSTQIEKETLKNFLDDLLKRHGVKGEAYTAFANNRVTIKNLEFPRMPLNDLAGAIQWELKDKLKSKYEEISSDYIILNENKLNAVEHIDVLSVSAQKDEIMEHIEVLEGCGLKVLAIEPNSFALVASLIFNQRIREDDVAIVIDFGGAISSLNIIRNNELHYTRTLNVNGNSFVNAVKDYCRVSFKEAEEVIKGFSNGKEMDKLKIPQQYIPGVESINQSVLVKNAISFQLEKIVTDIEHTFKYYSYQLTKSKITQYSKVILCGGAANFPVLVPFLQERLSVPVEIDDPLRVFKVKNGETIEESYLNTDAIRFSVAVGLALRVVE